MQLAALACEREELLPVAALEHPQADARAFRRRRRLDLGGAHAEARDRGEWAAAEHRASYTRNHSSPIMTDRGGRE